MNVRNLLWFIQCLSKSISNRLHEDSNLSKFMHRLDGHDLQRTLSASAWLEYSGSGSGPYLLDHDSASAEQLNHDLGQVTLCAHSKVF